MTLFYTITVKKLCQTPALAKRKGCPLPYLCSMHYVSVENLGKSYGIQPLFSGLSFHISEGDKIALVARNGAGKSTLLKIVAGIDVPDEGNIWVNKNVDLAMFEQEPLLRDQDSILDNIFYHNHPVINAIRQYEEAIDIGNEEGITAALPKMNELNAWYFESKVKQILGKLNIHQLNQKVGVLSGGQKKRVALAKTREGVIDWLKGLDRDRDRD